MDGGNEAGASTIFGLAPPLAWLVMFLLAPLTLVVAVSFMTPVLSGYEPVLTLINYIDVFASRTYLDTVTVTVANAATVTVLALVIAYPVAYFLTFHIDRLALKVALFVIALAPFWVSFLIRVIAWLPLLGREGVINQALLGMGVVAAPVEILLFSNFAVLLTMLQLYVLFMVAPIFFSLSAIDRQLFEAARDLGAGPVEIFRRIVWPLSLPGVITGCIFVFVLAMGDFATTRLIGGGNVSSIGLLIQNLVTYLQFPLAAAVASLLVAALVAGMWALLRARNIMEQI